MVSKDEALAELQRRQAIEELARRNVPAKTEDYQQFNALQRGMARPVIGTAQALGIEGALGGTPETAAMAAQELNRQGEGTGIGGLVGEIAGDPRAWLAGLAAPITAPMAMTPQGRALLGGAYGATEPVTSTGTDAMIERGANTALSASGAAITPWATNQVGKGVKAVVGKTGAPKAIEYLKSQFTPADIEKSIGRIEELQKIGVKAPLATIAPESVFQIAATRAQTLQGANVAKKSVQTLATDIARAESDLIENLAKTSKDALSDAEVFKTSATSIKNAIIDSRKAKANVLYGAIADKKIPPNLVQNMVNSSPVLRAEFASIPNSPVTQELIGSAKPNTVAYLDAVKKSIDGKIQTAMRAGDTANVAAYQQAKTRLIDGVEQYVPAYKDARFAFETDSNILDKFVGGKKGAINQILSLADEDATKAFNKVFSLQPQQIEKMRRTFEKMGQKGAFNSLSRGYVTQKLVKAAGSQTEGKVNLAKVLNNQIDRDRVGAAIGDKNKLKLFQQVLNAQDEVLNNAKALAPRSGSPTFARAAAQEQMQTQAQSKFGRLTGALAAGKQRLGSLGGFNSKEVQQLSQNEAFYTELQRILFDPSSGEQFLKAYNKSGNKAAIINNIYEQAAGRAGVVLGAEAGIGVSNELTQGAK